MNEFFGDDFLIRSSSYAETMNGTVLPWLRQKEHESIVSGFENRPLYCVSYNAEKPLGTVFILHGFTENAFKYSELIWSLLHLHYSVVAYDQRGHGRSWRADGIPDVSVTHVDRFSEYVEDLRIVCDTYSGMPGPFLLFAHSMGGAVASLFLEQYPDVFSAAVLSAPMIAPNIGGVPVCIASALGFSARMLGRQKKNPFFLRRYSGPEDFETSCASDPNRFAWYDAVKASRTEFRNAVPSYRWSEESIHVTKKILAAGQPEKIRCPILLFSAESDSSVLPGPQTDLINRVRNGTLIPVARSRHEIYRSTDDVLFPWWHKVIIYFSDIVSDTALYGGSR